VIMSKTVRVKAELVKESGARFPREPFSDICNKLLQDALAGRVEVAARCADCGYRRLAEAVTRFIELGKLTITVVTPGVKAEVKREEVPEFELATEKQKAFIRDLCRRAGTEAPETLSALSKQKASKLIDELMGEAEPWRRNGKEKGYHEFNTPVKNPEKFAKEGLLVSGKVVVDPERFIKLREGKKLFELPEREQEIANWLRDAGHCWVAADGSIARS